MYQYVCCVLLRRELGAEKIENSEIEVQQILADVVHVNGKD